MGTYTITASKIVQYSLFHESGLILMTQAPETESFRIVISIGKDYIIYRCR